MNAQSKPLLFRYEQKLAAVAIGDPCLVLFDHKEPASLLLAQGAREDSRGNRGSNQETAEAMKSEHIRPRRRAALKPPRFRKGAELIIKACPTLSLSRPEFEFLAGIYLLGNRLGYRWLSDYFAWRAKRLDEGDVFYTEDPDDHDHLALYPLLNRTLSDDIDVQLGSFSNKLRRRVLKACNINRKRVFQGELTAMFRSTLDFLRTLSKDKRGRNHKSWPRVIAALRQLIGEAEETVAQLEAVTKQARRMESRAPSKTGQQRTTR